MISTINLNEEICGPLFKYIQDDNITDIKWNGTTLWLNDLTKGRYVAKDENDKAIELSEEFLSILAKKISNSNNVNFNQAYPTLQAETPELRIQVLHPSVTGNGAHILAIRKTPAVVRLKNKDLVKEGYADELTIALLPCLMRARLSGIVIGDVGAGKTEMQKYLIQFIPETDGIFTVEDTLEMKADVLYPEKDIITVKYNDKTFTELDAIKANLRLVNKWLILAEARGKDIAQVIEGSSTGCTALCTIHAENTWEIPDRIVNMLEDANRENVTNDVFTFFRYAIKIKQHISEKGIARSIDQVTFFTRENNENITTVFLKNGKLTGNKLPDSIIEKIKQTAYDLNDFNKFEKVFLEKYEAKMSEDENE